MYTLFIAIALFIIVFIIFFLPINEYNKFNWPDFIGTFVVFVIAYGFLIFILRVIIISDEKQFVREYKDQPIKSLVLKNPISEGSFFLGCGSVSGKDYYVSYIPTEKGDLRIKYNAYTTYVNETDSISPIIKKYWVRSYRPYTINKWVWNFEEKTGPWRENYDEKIVFVPKNTIYTEFSIKE